MATLRKSLSLAPEAFDGVSLSIGDRVVRDRSLAGSRSRDDGLGVALSEAFPEVIGVIAAIRQQALEGSGRLDRGMSHGNVVGVSGAEQQHAGPATVVHQAMDLRRSTASRASYALEEGPPLAPAAER